MSHTHFTLETRIKLEDRLDDFISVPIIANKLGFSISSIYREVHRNCFTKEELITRDFPGLKHSGHGRIATPHNRFHYSAEVAQYKADRRKVLINKTMHTKLIRPENKSLADTIIRLIKKHWSPETISGCLSRGFIQIDGVKRRIKIATQTIYNFIYKFHNELRKYMRHKRGYAYRSKAFLIREIRRKVQEERDIAKRPNSANNRTRIGHWEGDTILGSKNGATGRIATFVERKTGYLVAFKLDPNDRPEDFTPAMTFADGAAEHLSKNIKPKYLKTLTLDNGSENAEYEWLEKKIPTLRIYFAHAYHSWERGTNENTNGLLRQYFPKGTDFRKIAQSDLDRVVREINNRPRKRLNWRSPRWEMARYKGLTLFAI